MPNWAPEDLATIGGTQEIQITTLRRDGTARSYVPIWVVRAGDAVFVRSYRGSGGGWYRHAQQYPHGRIKAHGIEHDVEFADAVGASTELIDQAYRDKYGAHGGSYVDTMVRPDAATTTMTLLPE